MFAAVRSGPTAYTQEQCQAWVPELRCRAEWSARLAKQFVLLAERQHESVGFKSLEADGYIDLAFILPSFQKTGLFRRLYDGIEEQARKLGEDRLWLHASLMAQPASSAVGFEIVESRLSRFVGSNFDASKCKNVWIRFLAATVDDYYIVIITPRDSD
ncbi:MAG: GNAT family N-acetyltransferase [Aureliella sp.]